MNTNIQNRCLLCGFSLSPAETKKSKRNALQAAEDFLEEKSVNEDFFGQTATDVAGLSGRKVVCQFA